MLKCALLLLGATSAAWATCSGSGLSGSCTAGSTESQVNTLINSLSDGAVITFAAGAYSWGSAGNVDFNQTKGITLQGAGSSTSGSVVTFGGSPGIGMNGTLTGNNTHTYRITGFRFVSGGSGQIPLWFYGSGTPTIHNLRIDNNVFTGFSSGEGIAIILGEVTHPTNFYGVLIDHNTFTDANNFMAMKILGNQSPDSYASSARGTANNVFLEDNTFSFAATPSDGSFLGSGCIDAWNTSSVVFRYNTVTDCLITAHGVDHTGGAMNFEIYGNKLQLNSGWYSPWSSGNRMIHHQGSGEMFVWGNTFLPFTTPIDADAVSVTHYRAVNSNTTEGNPGLYKTCDGTATVPVLSSISDSADGNTSPNGTYAGWPCWMQPGRAPHGGSPVYGTLSPIYVWANKDPSSNPVPIAVEAPWAPDPQNNDVFLQLANNRDYYNAVGGIQTSSSSPFSGTSGVGFGTLANRPSTCSNNPAPNGETTGGVAYYVTDGTTTHPTTGGYIGGTLYRCDPSNAWVAWYTPYTYPNPLIGGATAPAVTTTTASGITTTAASSGGTVTSNGGASVTSEGTCYAITSNPTTPCTSDGTATPFTSSLTGLSSGTVYHYRAFATNSAGTGFGTDLTFTTLSPAVAAVASGAVLIGVFR